LKLLSNSSNVGPIVVFYWTCNPWISYRNLYAAIPVVAIHSCQKLTPLFSPRIAGPTVQ